MTDTPDDDDDDIDGCPRCGSVWDNDEIPEWHHPGCTWPACLRCGKPIEGDEHRCAPIDGTEG